jgi:hypothetical protein
MKYALQRIDLFTMSLGYAYHPIAASRLQSLYLTYILSLWSCLSARNGLKVRANILQHICTLLKRQLLKGVFGVTEVRFSHASA